MPHYKRMVKRQRKEMIAVLFILIIGVITIPYPKVMTGLLIGILAGFLNLWLLHQKIRKFVRHAVREKSRVRLGTINRFAIAGLAALLAVQFEAYISIFAFVAGLGAAYAVIILDGICDSYMRQKEETG